MFLSWCLQKQMQPVKSAGESTHILLTVELTHKSYILSRRLNLDFKSIDFSRGWDYWPNEKRCIPFLNSFFKKLLQSFPLHWKMARQNFLTITHFSCWTLSINIRLESKLNSKMFLIYPKSVYVNYVCIFNFFAEIRECPNGLYRISEL